MARIRSTKPEFWSDRKLARKTSRSARLLYKGLWNLADEWGRLGGDPAYIRGQIYPFEADLDDTSVGHMLDQLEDAGSVIRYDVDGDPYLWLPKLDKHQRLEPQKVPSRLPAPPSDLVKSEMESRADSYAPRSDESAPDPDKTARRRANPRRDRTSDPHADSSAPRADESARGADSSALKQVAGSREHAAGSSSTREVAAKPAAAAADPVDNFDDLADLKAALVAAGLPEVRWDKTSRWSGKDVRALIDRHGIDRLVASAKQQLRPNDPPKFAGAWVSAWQQLADVATLPGPPPWCGHCSDPTTRQIEVDGKPRRCPDCHPLAVRRTA